MARRHRVQISLFPFMSVLACTIGSLIVLLAVLSLSSVGASRASERADEERVLLSALERKQLEAERAPIAEAEAAWREVDVFLTSLGLEAGIAIPQIEHYVDGRRAEAEAADTLAELASERRRLEEDREGVETRIAVLESRRETLPILIDPTGLSQRWKPFFIECDSGGATAYRATDDFQYFVPVENLAASGDFGRYLRRVRATPGALLVLLVRPDGIATARRAAGVARDAGVRVARLPLPGTGELDWTLLRTAEGEG